MILKSVTMISSELDPFYIRGGIAFAIRRLADQLTGLGIETRVLLPEWVDIRAGQDLKPLLMPIPLKMRAGVDRASRTQRYSEFCYAAFEAIEQIGTTPAVDAVIAHSDEGAMFIVLRSRERWRTPSVFWLHSLYDPPITDIPKEQRRLLPCQSLLASAVKMADIVVMSTGILKDARDFEWPDRLKELQKALINASAENRVLPVESAGCLPEVPKTAGNKLNPGSNLEQLQSVPSPYVLFPCRPTVKKGFAIFAALAERLRADNIACVALQPPAHAEKLDRPPRNPPVYWLPWLNQQELSVAMRNATCTVLPSLTEGFGLTAAESISLGVPTLYHPVGGQHGLPALPNALPIPLTKRERGLLYRLWSELIDTYADSWSVWSRHEVSMRPLIDKWVEAIRSTIDRTGSPPERQNGHFSGWPRDEERWGNKLSHRIAVGV